MTRFEFEALHQLFLSNSSINLSLSTYSFPSQLLGKPFSNFCNSPLSPLLLPLDNITLLHVASILGSLELFYFIQSELHISIDCLSADSYTPLHYACITGSIEIVSYILSNNPELSNSVSNNNITFTPLYLATKSKSAEIVRILLENGATTSNDVKFEKTPIYQTILLNDFESFELLINFYPKYKNEMLKVAIINNNIKTLKYLLEMNKPTKNENDLLYYACFLSNVEAVRVLCNYNCLDENEFDELFPVHLMCLSKNLEIAKLILKKNIDVNKVDKNGFTGPHYMINAGSDVFIGIMMLLLSNGFDVNNINAVSVLSECCLCYPCDSKKIIWLVNNGFSTDEKLKINNDEMTILQFLEKSNPEVYTKIVHENDSKHDILETNFE